MRFFNAPTFLTVEDSFGYSLQPPGQWSLTASRSGYYDYTHSGQVEIFESNETEINFAMVPKPEDAIIRGVVKDKSLGYPLYQYVSLFKNGSYVTRDHTWWSSSYKTRSPGEFVFVVKFDDTNPRCFTVVTSSSTSSSTYPYRYNSHCGDFADAQGWGKNYNYQGWASSFVLSGGPWFGSSVTDNICVNPGDDYDMGVIPLVDNPTATVSGSVKDSAGNPVPGAVIYFYWHNGVYFGYTYSDGSGNYSRTIFAEQELFPDTPDTQEYYIKTRAKGAVPKNKCCEQEGTTTQYSPWYRLGPVYEGMALTQDYVINLPADDICGDVKGRVVNGLTGANLSDVQVRIYGDKYTNNAGKYHFKCAAPVSCSIPVGSYRVKAYHSGFYSSNSTGNAYYENRGKVSVSEGETTTFEDIRLWPIGYGKITGRVVDAGNGMPLKGATVKFDVDSDGYNYTAITDSNGMFTFNTVRESWPPPEVVGDPYYKQDARVHRLYISYNPSLYYDRTVTDITLNAGETKDLGDIALGRKGLM